MYYFDEALVKRKDQRSKWESRDISQLTLTEIYNSFVKGYIKVHRGSAAPFWVLMDTFWNGQYKIVWAQTLEMWLQSLPNSVTFPNLQINPTVSETTIRYCDGWRAGYDATRVSDTSNILANVPLLEKRDLLITKDHIDYDIVNQHCLFTVNGLLHKSYHEPGYGIRISQGGGSVDISHQNDFGILSFQHLGTLEQVAIEDAMFSNVPDHSDYSHGFYININRNLVGKTVLLSIGGYLHVLDNVYSVDNPDIGMIKITPRKINLIPRLFESLQLIDLSSLPRTVMPNIPHALNLSEVWSEAFIKAYFKLPQSFVIILDTPDVFVELKALESSLLPGKYQVYQEPIYPFYTTTGHLPEYWSTLEDDIYVISVNRGYSPQYQFDTTTWVDEPWVLPNLLPFRPVTYSILTQLKLGKEIITL